MLTIIQSAFQSSGFPGFRNDQRNTSEFLSVCNNLNVLLLRLAKTT